MATNIKLLDENALSAIKTYVDTQVGKAGKVDDVKINGTTIVDSGKVAKIAVDGTYNASSNKVATQTTVSNAIGALDVPASGTGAITGFGAGKTLATLTETDGKIAATFQDIQLASTSKVTGLDTALAGKVPTSRTIAGLALSGNITSADLITALGLQQAMTYIGVATTTKPSAGNYVQTVIGSTTYYVSLTSSGTATQVNAVKGQILTIGTKEYICTTAGASGTNVFSEMGDEGSYALKTVTVTGTGALGGGGNLTTNRTITHNELNTSGAKTTAGVYKVKIDKYGHITEATAATLDDVNDGAVRKLTDYVSKQGAQTITGKKTFSHADGVAISNAGATATLSVTNDSESGELTISGVDYLNLPFVTFGNIIEASGIWAHGNNNTITLGGSEEGRVTLTNGSYSTSSYNNNVIYKTNWNNGSTIAVSTYGVQFPDTHGYTANRTLATTADIPSVSDFVTKSTAQTITARKTFTASAEFQGNTAILFSQGSGQDETVGISRYTEGGTASTGATRNLLAIYSSNDASNAPTGILLGGKAALISDYTSDTSGNIRYYKLPAKSAGTYTIALTSDIPSVSDFVTKSTAQTITGTKTFQTNSGILLKSADTASDNYGVKLIPHYEGDGGGNYLEITRGDGEYAGLSLKGYLSAPIAYISTISRSGGDALFFGHSEEGTFVISNGDYSIYNGSGTKTHDGNIIYKTYWKDNNDNFHLSDYGLKFPETKAWTADRTIATTSDLSGFVTGPSSATSGAIALYDTTTGKKIKNSAITTQTNDRGLVFGNAGTNEYNYIRFGSANRAGTHELVIRNHSAAGNYSDTSLYIESTGTTSSPKLNCLGTSENHFGMAFIDTFTDGDNNLDFSTLLNHVNNTTIHITSAERTAWNGKISSVKSLKTDNTATQSTSSSEAIAGSGTINLHRISKTGKLSHLLSDDGGSVSVITTAEINAILYPSA